MQSRALANTLGMYDCALNGRSNSCCGFSACVTAAGLSSIRNDTPICKTSTGALYRRIERMRPNNIGEAVCRALVAASVAAIVALATPAFAQTTTTGQVVGTIVDAQGGVLPGVTVSATSPQLQGTRTAVSDSTGTFRFPTLPPGVYAIKAELAGFKPLSQENITVSLDRSVSLNLKMQVAGVTAEVTVLGSSPVVDTTSAAGGVTIDEKMMTLLPTQRNFYATARFAPGVTADAVGPTMLGSSGAENKYIIDGIDATGIMDGRQNKT